MRGVRLLPVLLVATAVALYHATGYSYVEPPPPNYVYVIDPWTMNLTLVNTTVIDMARLERPIIAFKVSQWSITTEVVETFLFTMTLPKDCEPMCRIASVQRAFLNYTPYTPIILLLPCDVPDSTYRVEIRNYPMPEPAKLVAVFRGGNMTLFYVYPISNAVLRIPYTKVEIPIVASNANETAVESSCIYVPSNAAELAESLMEMRGVPLEAEVDEWYEVPQLWFEVLLIDEEYRWVIRGVGDTLSFLVPLR